MALSGFVAAGRVRSFRKKTVPCPAHEIVALPVPPVATIGPSKFPTRSSTSFVPSTTHETVVVPRPDFGQIGTGLGSATRDAVTFVETRGASILALFTTSGGQYP